MSEEDTSGKLQIFRYFALLLSNQDNSRLFSNSVIAISFLQNIGLTLQNSMSLIRVTTREPLVFIISQIANMMTISFWVRLIGAYNFLPYFRILVNLAIFSFFILLVIVYRKVQKAKNFTRLKRLNITGLPLLKKLHTLLVPILIQYILEMLLPTVICKEFIPEFYKKNTNAYECKSPLNILYIFIAISWIQALVCIFYTGFIAYLGFDETISRNNKLGKRNNQLDFWVMFGKIYLVTWNIFVIPSKFMFGIYFVSYLIISIHEISLAIQHVFFDFKMYRFFLTFFFFEKGVFLSFSIMNMLGFKLFDYNLAVVVLIFVLIFMARFASNMAYRVAINFKSTEDKKGEGYDKLMGLCGYLSCYERILINYPRIVKEGVAETSTIEFFNGLIGILKRHLQECTKVNCFCRAKNKLPNPCDNTYTDLSNRDDIIFNSTMLKHFVKSLLETPLKMVPSNASLRLSLIDHLFKNMEHIHLTVVHLNLVYKHVKSLQKRYRIFKIKDALMLYLERKNQNVYNISWMSNFNIEAISKLEQNYYNLKDTISSFSEKYIEFLDLILTSVKTDLNKIEACHHTLLEMEEKIETIYEEISDNPKSMKLYSMYKREILDDQETALEIEKKMEKLLEKIKISKQEEKLFYEVNLMLDDDTALIEIGALTENMGYIIKTNPGAEKLTGYTMNELRTMNVEELMPEPIAKHHSGFLSNFYKTGISNFLYREQETFMRRKDGYILPVSLLVKPMFDPIKNDYHYISYLQSRVTSFDYIMVSDLGRMIGLTKGFTEYLGWLPRDFEKNDIYIQNIIPELFDMFSSIHLMTAQKSDRIDYRELVNNLKLKVENSGFFRCKLYNNKLPLSPFPNQSELNSSIIGKMTDEEIDQLYYKKKKDVYRVCNNMNTKHDLEFLIDPYKIGSKNTVYILKIRNYISMNEQGHKPIRSYFCKKYCRLIIFYMKFVRLLKKVRARKRAELAKNMKKAIIAKKAVSFEKKRRGSYRHDSAKNIEHINFMLATGVVQAVHNPNQKNKHQKIKRKRTRQGISYQGGGTDSDSEREKSKEESFRRKEMLKELQEGSVNSASSVRGTNMRINIKNSINSPYQPTSFRLLKIFSLFLIVITFVATQLLLIYQTIYYKRLRKSLLTQSLLFDYENKIQKITHLNMYLFLVDRKYHVVGEETQFKLRNETEANLRTEINASISVLRELKEHRLYLNQKFNGQSLSTYLSHHNTFNFSAKKENLNIGFLLSTMQTIRASYDLLSQPSYLEGKSLVLFSELFSNIKTMTNTIYMNMMVDPYNSFISNFRFVVMLILTSLIINTLNGVAIIRSLYNSLKYLDNVFQLVTTIPHFELSSLREVVASPLSEDDEDMLKKKNPRMRNNNAKEMGGVGEKYYSKDYTKIKKPMWRLSCSIFVSIFILSGFYLLSLYALGFFGGEVETLLRLKKMIFQAQMEFYSLDFEMRNHVYRDFLSYSGDDSIHTILERSSELRHNSYEIDKAISGLNDRELRDELFGLTDVSICDELTDSNYFGFECEKIRSKVLQRGKKNKLRLSLN